MSDDQPDPTAPDAEAPDAQEVPFEGAQAEEADAIVAFWEVARSQARLGRLQALAGPGAGAVVVPPAWAFGDNPALADELLALVLAGEKTATASSVAELESADEALPAVGDLSIVLDGAGHPRALIRTTAVRVVPFRDVDEDFAAREGEDDRTLASWRREHERYFRRVLAGTGTEFSEDLDVVLEDFEVLYPRPPRS